MKLKRWISIIFVIAALAPSALGQLQQVNDPADFSGESVRLDFSFFPPQSIQDAGRSLSAWGVRFSGNLGSQAQIEGTLTATVPVPVVEPVLKNMGGTGSPKLIMDLDHAATRVGLWLGGEAGTQVTLTAFGPDGEAFGSTQKTGLSASGTFVGVRAPAGKTIAKLVVAYDNAPNVEQVHRILVEYANRRPFQVVLAQIADGPVGSQAFKTTLVITNVSNTTSEGELRLFASSKDSTPPPLVLTLDGPDGAETGSVFPFTLAPFASITYSTQGVGPGIAVGYATIAAAAPVGGTAIFSTVNGDGSIDLEAGVGGSGGVRVSTGAVLKLGQLDSGLAVVNTSTTDPVDARVQLLDADGNVVATNEDILDLAAGGHVARFLGEMFAGVSDPFQGSVVITANRPVALVVLRTVNGIVASSLPVGSTER